MRTLWAALAVTAAMVAPAAQSETLADALIAAYKNSHLLDQNQAVLRAADEDAAAAMARLRPVIEFAMQSTYTAKSVDHVKVPPAFESWTADAQLKLSQVIYAGGRGKLAVEIAREAVLATRASLVNTEQQVLLDAISAYVDVRLQSEIVALRESNMRLIAQELRAAKDRFDVGEVTLTDVSLAEARLAAARSGLAAAQGALAVARESYKAATGSYPGNLAALPKLPIAAKSQADALTVAVRTHPVVIQSQHQAKIAALQVQVAEGAMKTTVSADVTVNQNIYSDLGSVTAGLYGKQIIYQGGELSSDYRQALARKEAAEAGMHLTVVQVTEAIGQAWSNLLVANASIEAGSLQVTAAQKAFDGVREEATLGARTTLDVLNAEQELLNARATKLQAEASRYVGVYKLLATMGLLTADHLKLGIPTFDPEAYYNAVKNAPATSTRGKKLDKILEKIAK